MIKRLMSDGTSFLACAIVFATLSSAWLFRYETLGHGVYHRNRITGAVCQVRNSCWLQHQPVNWR